MKTPFSALEISPMAPFFSYIKASSSTSPSPKGSLLLTPLHWPGTELRLSLHTGNVSTASAIVLQKGFWTANVTATSHSLTAILAGILPETAGITAMTYICPSLPILRATCLFSRCSHRLPLMTPTGSCIAFFG